MPTHVKLIVFPVVVYLLVLFWVAGFVTNPPLLGWIGFGVVAVIGLAAAGLAVVLYPRTRTNAPREQPDVEHGERVLVLVDSHCSAHSLGRAVKEVLHGRKAEVLVVAPLLPSPFHFLTESERDDADDARVRLTEALSTLGHHGIFARGKIGGDDPLQSIADALVQFHATQIVLVESEGSRSWLEAGLAHRARDAFGVHVTTATESGYPVA